MSKRIHSLEGREEHVRELGNAAHGKQELTCWRGGRGRSGLASLEMWHVAKEVPSWGRRGGGGVCERGRKGSKKKRSHFLEGRKRRRKLVSSETWHAGNEDSLSGGEEEGGTGW